MHSWQQRLGKNKTCYAGETINIQQVLEEMQQLAREKGWHQEPILDSGELVLVHLRRNPSQARKRIYLSTGIHGDEPAGPLAVLELVREDEFPEGLELWMCPCLNPSGFSLNRRENALGFDLNRQYHCPECPETVAHIQWLAQAPSFDMAICLHEDWEASGFYLYELNPDGRPSPAQQVIEQVAQVCPIDLSPEIEGRPAQGGIIHPSTDPRSRPQWPEAFYLLTHKTRHSFTLEAPSDFPLAVRVRALKRAVKTICESVV